MNWTRVLLGGVAAGIVVNLTGFVLHGMVMAPTYTRYPEVFNQEQSSPLLFLAASIAIAITVAILFARTRQSWGAGWKGGLAFGFFFGLATFFLNFYAALVYEGFPYFLVWCWGGIGMIENLLGGAVLGLIIPRQP